MSDGTLTFRYLAIDSLANQWVNKIDRDPRSEDLCLTELIA
jgi:hypothetical protein